jgi:hypothetical protein
MTLSFNDIPTIAAEFQANCYEGIELAEKTLCPLGYERQDIMRKDRTTGYVMRLAIFAKDSTWIVLNYSDERNELVVFADNQSYQQYTNRQHFRTFMNSVL